MKLTRFNELIRRRMQRPLGFAVTLGLGLVVALPLRAQQYPPPPPPAPSVVPPPAPVQDPGYTTRMYHMYSAKRTVGIIMAGVLAPMFAGVTVGGNLLIYRHGREDHGGFCNHVTRNDFGDYRRDCEGDGGELAGMILLSTFGTALTLSMLIPGTVQIGRYGGRIRRLGPMAEGAAPSTPVTFALAVGPKEVSVGFQF